MKKHLWLAILATLLIGLIQVEVFRAQTALPIIYVLTADGPVTPAMREYLRRGRTAKCLSHHLSTQYPRRKC